MFKCAFYATLWIHTNVHISKTYLAVWEHFLLNYTKISVLGIGEEGERYCLLHGLHFCRR